MKKKSSILIIVLICFSILYGQFNRSDGFRVLTEGMGENNELKTANDWDLTNKIVIDNNWSDTRDTYDWCSGSGTSNEPYTIENITMNMQYTDGCIEIRNTNDFFIIKNSSFLNTIDSEFGIFLYNVTNGIIDDCKLLNNILAGLVLDHCEYVTISNNTFETNLIESAEGIQLQYYCKHTSILKNRIKIKGAGIQIKYYCDDNIIRENIWEKGEFRILGSCDNNIVENNTFSNCVLRIYDNQFNKVLNNTFLTNNYYSSVIRLRASNTTINNNLITIGSINGIELESGCDFNYIYHNTISNCDNCIKLGAGSDNNIITSNTLRNSRDAGISITGNNNKVFYNIFEQNPINAIDDGYDTKWNESTSGNYWDDYAGLDANDDGIGDTPYNITSTLGRPDSQDHLPIWYTIPQITINSPANNSYWNTEPSINLIATDATLNCTWYNVSDQREFLQSGVAEYLRADIWTSLPEGPFLIEFFANDSININDKNKYILTKDTIAPVIEIEHPLESTIFTSCPNWFEVSINESNLNQSWYTLNKQETRYYFNGTIGTIDDAAWNSLPNGNVNITFGVNDKAGNITFKSIIVKKQHPNGNPEGIPSYNLLVLLSVLLGTIALLSLIRIKKLNKF